MSDEIKCVIFGLSCKHNKIWEWSECVRKAGHKKWFEKRSFWHAWDLNAWCGCDRSFLYLFDSNPSSQSSWGAKWRRVWLGQIYNARTITGTLGQGKINIFYLPVCFALGTIMLPRESQPILPQKACSTRDVDALIFLTVHWSKQSMSPLFMLMRCCEPWRWFLLHVRACTDAPSMHALLAFVTTPET